MIASASAGAPVDVSTASGEDVLPLENVARLAKKSKYGKVCLFSHDFLWDCVFGYTHLSALQ